MNRKRTLKLKVFTRFNLFRILFLQQRYVPLLVAGQKNADYIYFPAGVILGSLA